MKTYGLDQRHLDIIKKAINKVYKKEGVPKVYLFGSRATGKHRNNSDIDLAIKSNANSDELIEKLKSFFEDSDLPYKVDLVDYDKIIEDYLPSIRKEKVLLWSPEQKDRSTKWRACPLGEHWVKRHNKTNKTGTTGDWDGHCRKNPSGKDILKADELELISQSKVFLNAKPKVSRKTLGFRNGNKYNHFITGWVAYWNSIFKPEVPLHPNYVKVLIATESGFKTKESAENKLNVGQAEGLVQLTEQTQNILKDTKGELKDHYVQLKKKDIWDANKNIAASVRWLFRKKETARAKLKREPTWEEVLIEYKGITKQKKHPKAVKIRKNVKRLLKEVNEGT